LQETRERLSFPANCSRVQACARKRKIKAQGVVRPPPLVPVDTSLNYVVVALRQVYPSIESLFDGGSDEQTFMSLACGSACSVTVTANETSRFVLALFFREMCESVMQGRVWFL
jgi:hypothetical protein